MRRHTKISLTKAMGVLDIKARVVSNRSTSQFATSQEQEWEGQRVFSNRG